MNYYDKIKKKLIDNEIYAKVKDYSKEQHKVVTYFEIGRLLSEAGGRYGDKIIEKYSERLMVEVGHKYNRRTLFRMEQFYKIFSDQKVSPLVTQLTWTHYVILISLKDYEKINYYMDQCARLNLSKRQLEQRIKNQEYERLPESTKSKLKKKEPTLVNDFVKDPILIKTVETQDEISEKILQRLILENIPAFLKELGNGFSFIDNEHKIKLGDRHNYIDILLYNVIYKCYVVIELKTTALTAEHTGQIQKYMNYIDKKLRGLGDDKTVGIVICKRNNRYVIEYCSDDRIISREYKLTQNIIDKK